MRSFPTALTAQTHEQSEDLDRWARYTVNLRICADFGILVPSNAGETGGPINRAMRQEAQSWGLSFNEALGLVASAKRRQEQIYGQEFEIHSAKAKDASIEASQSVEGIFRQYGQECLEAKKDAFYGEFLTIPAEFDLDAKATELADNLLFGGGLANWQTPIIVARADIVLLAGACRRHISAALSDKLRETYGRSDDPRERRYYNWSFDQGLRGKIAANLDATQCSRAIGSNREKIHDLK